MHDVLSIEGIHSYRFHKVKNMINNYNNINQINSKQPVPTTHLLVNVASLFFLLDCLQVLNEIQELGYASYLILLEHAKVEKSLVVIGISITH